MPKDFNLRLYKLQENYIQKVSEKGLPPLCFILYNINVYQCFGYVHFPAARGKEFAFARFLN